MRARPAWVRRLGTTLGIGVGLGIVIVGYLYLKVTAAVDAGAFKEPNALDAREADRKIGLYKKALQGRERSGFIRLSEVEINSYLRQHYFSDRTQGPTNAVDSTARLLESRLKFSEQEIFWYCWIRKKMFGWSIPLVWQRGVELNQATNRWIFETRSMALGKLEVPLRFWPLVNRELGEVDRIFADECRWVAGLPLLEIRTNSMSSNPELRLYTHSVGGPSRARKP